MFETRRWSIVAAEGNDDSAACCAALAVLCETYRYSLYAYVRGHGVDADAARDLKQGLLASLPNRVYFGNLRNKINPGPLNPRSSSPLLQPAIEFRERRRIS
jgi:hypothetical protein